MRSGELVMTLLCLEVAERHRGSDDLHTYLRKLARTLTDMLAGRPVRPWRLERAQRFFDDLAATCLRKSAEGRGGRF